MERKNEENFLLMWYLGLSFTDITSMTNSDRNFLVEQIKLNFN